MTSPPFPWRRLVIRAGVPVVVVLGLSWWSSWRSQGYISGADISTGLVVLGFGGLVVAWMYRRWTRVE